MVVLEAEEQSSKGRGGQKLYRKGKQTGHREKEQKQERQKKKKGSKRKWGEAAEKMEMQLQSSLVFLTFLYVNWEKLLWYSKIIPPHLQSLRKYGFAFMTLKQRVVLVPGLKAASTFNMQWDKAACPHCNFLRSKRHTFGKAQTCLSNKNDTQLQNLALGFCTFGGNGAHNWCVRNLPNFESDSAENIWY